MSATPARGIGLADLLDGAWDLLVRRPREFLLLGLGSIVVQVLTPPEPEGVGARMGIALLVTLVTAWMTLGVVRLADREVAGERVGLGSVLAGSVRNLSRLVMTGFIFMLVLLLPVLVLGTVVIGVVVVATAAGGGQVVPNQAATIGVAVVVAPLLVVMVFTAFLPQVIQLRGAWGWDAVRASAGLVRRRFWRVAGNVVVLNVPIALLAVLTSILPGTWLTQSLLALPAVPLMPFVTTALTLLFLGLDPTRPAPARPATAPSFLPPTQPGGPMKILVLGGGAQGRVIANDIATRMPQASVTVADVRDPRLAALPNLAWREADCSSFDTVVGLMGEHDLAVGALPSRYGFAAMKAAIAARRNLVDVSFSAEDALDLDAAARAAGVTIVPDAGLAPGISNLLCGEAYARRGAPLELLIMVGGVAQDPAKPYGYCVTWSLDDLTEEYVRPARIVQGGQKVVVPVFSGMERVPVEGVGEMEAFYSDGLRSLMDTLPGVPEMGEKTLRWPGHAEAVQPLVAAGRLAEELRARCSLVPPEDLVALVVRMRWADGEERTTLVDRYDPASGLTAMARTTAFTTAVTAQMLAGGLVPPPGVQPLERVAQDPRAFHAMVDGLAAHGVRLERRGA